MTYHSPVGQRMRLFIALCCLFSSKPDDVEAVIQLDRRACYPGQSSLESIYRFVYPDIWEKRNISFTEYTGKVVLIINVATYCPFSLQYHALNILEQTYNNLVVLGLPCNQFSKQEPGANATEILNGVKYVRPGNGFVPNFQMFKKIDVNGENEIGLYTYLKRMCASTRDTFASATKLFYTPMTNSDVRWNFEKFLINKEGKPVMRYDPSTHPLNITRDIEMLL